MAGPFRAAVDQRDEAGDGGVDILVEGPNDHLRLPGRLAAHAVARQVASRPPRRARTRRDIAAFEAGARSLDQGVGAVLDALDRAELADEPLVILTTDHGLPFPGAKATLTDRGALVYERAVAAT